MDQVIIERGTKNSAKNSAKNQYGQYMTPQSIARFMLSLSQAPATGRALEPSAGTGVFIDLLKEKFTEIQGYEIDPELAARHPQVCHGSFLKIPSEAGYDLVIGNPPYIRWKNLEDELKAELTTDRLWSTYCNSLNDYSAVFILKAVEMLKEGGELIFITPDYWFNTTHSLKMRNYLVENGYFSDIIQFNETPVFEDASVSLVIFRYIKTRHSEKKPDIRVRKYLSNRKMSEADVQDLIADRETEKIRKLTIAPFQQNQRWLLTQPEVIRQMYVFEQACRPRQDQNYACIGDICDIGNGLVSGLDLAFQIGHMDFEPTTDEKKSLIAVVKAKDLQPFYSNSQTRYMLPESVETEAELAEKYPNFYKKLQPLREQLIGRYSYGRDLKYWQWAFLRNFKLFTRPQPRIFVPCKERVSHKDHFRFAYVEADFLPTQDVTALLTKPGTREDIFYILAFLNQKAVFEWLCHNGIVKGNIVEFSEKPLASIPFRRIDFENPNEVRQHDQIVQLTRNLVTGRDQSLIPEIEKIFASLLKR